ncbi:MAG: acyl carrier protein [Candidatus Omnitrophica bacterium]|nr:acyl carrier protein [Candidatus Omnitrophota bacterium]MDD5238363.1 acyl carrier protein [Candidatus Omnitrophota bacterium]
MQDIESEVRNLIAEVLEKDPAEIKADMRLVEDLGMDSLKALEVLVAVEKKYKITIPEEKLPALNTLDATVAIAKEFLAKKENNLSQP